MATYTTQVHPRTLTNKAIEEIAAQRTLAETEIHRICAGERRWTMCVPVQQDDSDMVFSDALDNSRRLEQEVYRLRAAMKQVASNPETPDAVQDALHAALFGTE